MKCFTYCHAFTLGKRWKGKAFDFSKKLKVFSPQNFPPNLKGQSQRVKVTFPKSDLTFMTCDVICDATCGTWFKIDVTSQTHSELGFDNSKLTIFSMPR